MLSAASASVLRTTVTKELGAALPAAPLETTPRDQTEAVARMRLIQSATSAEEGRVLRVAFAGLAFGDDALIAEAKRRALNLASWAPRGATGYRSDDFGATSISWTLALAYDWLYDHWSAQERSRLIAAIQPRVEDMLAAPVNNGLSGWASLDWGRKLDRNPYDSHGAVTLARFSVICTVLTDASELFNRCASEMVPRYLARPVVWGGADGGFANGTNYAQWDVAYTHFIVWHLLGNALGVDLWQSDWARGYLRFIAYFLPPGTPSGMFGDGAENANSGVWATQAKAYAAQLPSPLADWYAASQPGGNLTQLAVLLAPQRDWAAIPAVLPAGTPQAAYLADIGWVAMHSELGDRQRSSVYFKSSPYGSYSHSHADQNSFVVHARGRALAIDSGYYDFYDSPHAKGWYTQTRAHNAITFDGGQGQLTNAMAAKGAITRFEHQAQYDLSTGDATQAYGGALTRAQRSMVYLRPDAVLVFDSLASDTPRTWEWNLHALSRMQLQGAQGLQIEQDGVRMCVQLLQAPAGAFTQTDRFTTAPSGSYANQWHARYATQAKSTTANFLALLDIECRRPAVSVQREADRTVVTMAGKRFAFDSSGQAQALH